MLRIIGIVLVMLSGANFGAYLSSKVKKHIKTVETVNDMLRETGMMIRFNAITFKELIEHLKCCCAIGKLRFLQVDTEALDIRESIVEGIKNNDDGLSAEEAEKLYSFFLQFGTTDIDGQLSMVEKYQEYYFERMQNLRDESTKKCRLYNSLGALGGAFVAVMLV